MKRLTESLRKKTTAALLWSAIERFSHQGSAFVVQIILARILLPEQFGLLAMVIVFTSICSAVVDGGFEQALIQMDEISDRACSTVFYTNLIIALVMFVLLWAASDAIAFFYREPKLAQILPVLALTLILGAYGRVHLALLNRKMRFKRIFWVSLPAILIGGAVSIELALLGYGVWALVAQIIFSTAISSILLRFLSGWAPRATFSFSDLAAILPYGSRLAASSVLDTVFQNLYVLVIGRFYLPADIGFFQRAKLLQQVPVINLMQIINRVTFPLLATMKHEPERLKSTTARSLQLACLLSMTSMAAIAAATKPLIVILLGEKWLPSANYLQLLCVIGALHPWHAVNLNTLKAIGRSDAFLRLEVAKKALIVLNIFITFRYGISAMIYGMIVSSAIALYLNTRYSLRFMNFGLREQIRNLSRIITLALIIFLVVSGVAKTTELAPLTKLILGMCAAGALTLSAIPLLGKTVTHEFSLLIKRLPIKIRRMIILLTPVK